MVIHILEGDPGVNDSLVVLLGNLGHRVLSYRDGAAFFRRDPPRPDDCVIVDLALPGVSGITVIKWLQHLVDPPHIVPISAEPQGSIDARSRGLPIPPVLRKPLCEDDILARLRR